MLSNLFKRIWAEHVARVGVAAGDALASSSITTGNVKAQMITKEGKKMGLNMANLMGRYQPVLSVVKEAQPSNVGGVAKPKILERYYMEIGVFTRKEDCMNVREIGVFTSKEDCMDIREIGIFTSKEDCRRDEEIDIFTPKENEEIIKSELKGEIGPQQELQNNQNVDSEVREETRHADVPIRPDLLKEKMTELSEEISRDIQDLEVLLKACKVKRLESSINMEEDVRDDFSKKIIDVDSTVEIHEETNITVGVLVENEVVQFIEEEKYHAFYMSHDEQMEDLDPGKGVFIEQELSTLKTAPKRVRGARSHRPKTRRMERSRTNELSNGETGRRCQRVERISWASSRGKKRIRNAKSKSRGRQSAPLAHREKFIRQVKKKSFAIVPEEATAMSTNAMFDVKQLDEENQARILALQEDEIAKKEEVWGRRKAAAWGNAYTLVPVSVEKRRGSLVPLTGCKCEGADTAQSTNINHNVVGPHMAVVVMDRRQHGAMGADLGIGQAGAGAAHLPECQKLCLEEERMLREEDLKREATRRAEAAKEHAAKVENTKRLLAEVNGVSSIPKEEGRASLARKARRAEADRVATSKAKIDRARRCIFALQKLKADLPTAEARSGPPGAQSGGFEPFNALGGGEEKGEALNAHLEMRARIRQDALTAMQKKLAQNVVRMKAAGNAKGKKLP